MSQAQVQDIGTRGEALLQRNISAEEKVLFKLKGHFGQAIAVTEKRLYILKWGFMAGNLFGGRCLAFEFRSITGVKMTTNIMTGILEVVTPGNQDRNLGYWGKNNMDAKKADDAVTFPPLQFQIFQQAANTCRDLINQAHTR